MFGCDGTPETARTRPPRNGPMLRQRSIVEKSWAFRSRSPTKAAMRKSAIDFPNVERSFWGAHAPRMLVSAPRRNILRAAEKVRDGEGAIASTRGACAPRNCCHPSSDCRRIVGRPQGAEPGGTAGEGAAGLAAGAGVAAAAAAFAAAAAA